MLLAFAATAGLASSAQAATYKVGTLEDLTGTCQEPASGTCSLRQLVDYENSLPETPNPPDTIDVPAPEGVAYYDLVNGPLTIFKSVSIVGAGARAVSIFQESSPANRVFFVEPDPRNKIVPTVTISGLSMAFGHANEGNGFFGGDIRNEAVLTLSEDDITNGTAEEGSGGGIANDGGTLTLTHSLVANNYSTNLPNGAGGDSGAIQNVGPNPVTEAAGKLTVTDSTIAGNSAALGGGIFTWGDTANTTSIVNSTIANNDGGNRGTEGGGLLASEGTISVENSIVANNTVEDPLTGELVPSNCGNTGISSLGHNLQSAADCAFAATGDLENTEPGFLSSGLQDNGGNTDTLALEAASPAVDAIPSGAPGCTGTDQRGIARPQGTGCDIGAFELFQPVEGQQFSEVVGTASPREGTTPTINWGDGTAPSAGKVAANTGQLTGTHTYVNEGIYHAGFTYTNSDGFPETRPFDVKVQDAPITAAGVPVSATAGVAVKAKVATFTHANPAGVASDYTASIAWGDGTASTAGVVSAASGGGFEVTGSHTYAVAGQYTTTITINDIGGAKATATSSANVIGPPIVTNVQAISVTETTAKVGFTINPDGADTTYTIEYGPTTSYGQKTTSVDIGATLGPQSLTRTLTGLTPNSTYHFNVVATNSVAPKGVSGEDKSFTTEPDAPLSATGKPVNGTAGKTLSATVATFTDADPTGVASDYTATIIWGDGTASTAGTVSAASGGGFEVTGSHTYTTAGQYTTTITINDIGGAKATATSSANVIGPPIVTNVKAISVTETTAKVGFTINPDGADTTYTIEYGPTTSYGQKTASVDIGATPSPQSLTQTIKGLKPNKTYHFDVVATNSVAPKGVGGGDQSFTTEPDAPLTATGKPVSGTAGTTLSSTVATFTDADPNGVASDYTATIDWGDGTASTPGTVSAASGGGFEVTGSHTYTTAGQYTTTVTINDIGGAKATATSSANVTGPPAVTNVNVLSVTETTAKIGLTINPDGADTTYTIEYGPTTSYGRKTTPVDIGGTPGPQSLTQTITGLEPGSIYHFNVLATNSAGPGGVSSGDQPFTTVLPSPPGGQPNPSPMPTGPSTSNPNPPGPAGPGAGSGVLGFKATLAALPPPVLGKTVNVTPISGIVYIALPPGTTLASPSTASLSAASLSTFYPSSSFASFSPFPSFAPGEQASAAIVKWSALEALTKGRTFVPLTEARQIPVGSILETTHGVVGITTATTASPKGKLQSGDFGAGIFKLLQSRKQRGLTNWTSSTTSAPTKCARRSARPGSRPASRAAKCLADSMPADTGALPRVASTARRPCAVRSGA